MTRLFPLAAEGRIVNVSVGDWLWPMLAIVGLLVVAAVLVGAIRKRMRREEASPPAGFTLGDLRQLAKEGKMTQEEYERAKNKVLEASKRATAIKPGEPTSTPKQFPPGA
jgi:hypothetical protein